jgi:NAD(P)H-nitrite reductase large subunit
MLAGTTAAETEEMKPTEHLVIVGSGIAGIRAALTARATTPLCRITLVGDETSGFYNRIALAAWASQQRPLADLFWHPQNWLRTQNIDTRYGHRVTRIDANAHRLHLQDGSSLAWDRLILATGATPVVPPIPGVDLPGVAPLWTLDHAHTLRQRLTRTAHIGIIGGGILGTELALDLASAGHRVTLIEAEPHLLPQHLPPKAAARLAQHLQQQGIALHLGTSAASITRSTDTLTLHLQDDTAHPVDHIVLSTGVRPNVSLAQDAGLDVTFGIVVNHYMETSAPDILAAGNCTAQNGTGALLWNPAFMQGDTAGHNAFAHRVTLPPMVSPIHFKAVGFPLFIIGDSAQVLPGHRHIESDTPQTYRALTLTPEGRIHSAVFAGDTQRYPQVERAIATGYTVPSTLAHETDIEALISALAAHTPAPTAWACRTCGYTSDGPVAPTVCPVCAVGRDQFWAA